MWVKYVEALAEHLRVVLIHPKQIDDVVDSIGQVRPAFSAAPAWRVRGAVEPGGGYDGGGVQLGGGPSGVLSGVLKGWVSS